MTLHERLTGYLGHTRGTAVNVSRLTRYPSGFSWITYGFEADGEPLILRLGPGNGLYAPYSAEPEFAAMATLAGSAVPTPRVDHWSDDPALLGHPFLIAEKAPGTTPIPWGEDGMDDDRRAALGGQFADALGRLHAHDWTGSPLARFGEGLTTVNAARRQLDLWRGNYRRWAMRPQPMLHRVFAELAAAPPVAPRLSIVHGDYRLGNFLEVEGRITAILDWELVHLGDPHEDLAWTCLPQYRDGTALMSKLVSRDELYARHAAITGHPIDEGSMRWYNLFSLVKLAVTHIAAAYAFERGGFHDMRMPAMGTQVAPTLRQIEKLLAA